MLNITTCYLGKVQKILYSSFLNRNLLYYECTEAIVCSRMFNDLKNLYSLVLLNQFVASSATLCIGVYNISAEGK